MQLDVLPVGGKRGALEPGGVATFEPQSGGLCNHDALTVGNVESRAMRYDATSFPEDLVLMETSDRSNFQGRYVLRHPWSGAAACAAGDSYRAALPVRFKQEAKNLAGLTGWLQAEIETRMEADGQSLQGSR